MFLTLMAVLLATGHISAHAVGTGEDLDTPTGEISLKAICEGKSVRMPSMEEVAKLDAQVGQSDGECSLDVMSAVIDLAELVERTSENVCSEPNSRLIAEFANEHLSKGRLPKPIESFGMSYAMRASQGCKINAARVFAEDLLAPEDLAKIGQWTRNGGQIDHILSGLTSSGLPISLMELARMVVGNNKAVNQKKLVMNSALDEDIKKLKMVCGRRLRPIYRPLVEPVDNLFQAGFDYPDQLIRGELNLDAGQSERIALWSRIVYLCEMVDLMAAEVDPGLVRAESVGVSSKIMVTEVAPLPDDQLNELARKLEAKRDTSTSESREQFQRKLWTSVQSQMDPEEARWFASCTNGFSAACLKSPSNPKDGSRP